jgi:hypothetical protein
MKSLEHHESISKKMSNRATPAVRFDRRSVKSIYRRRRLHTIPSQGGGTPVNIDGGCTATICSFPFHSIPSLGRRDTQFAEAVPSNVQSRKVHLFRSSIQYKQCTYKQSIIRSGEGSE